MKTINQCIAGGIAAISVLVSTMAFAEQAPLPSQPRGGERIQSAPRGPDMPARPLMNENEREQYKAYAEDRMQARLNLWARQLQITQDQQSAWKAYSQALKQMVTAPYTISFPVPDADAASIAQFRANMAAEHAQRLAAVSKATSQLQAVLRPQQQTEFNQLVGYGNGPRNGWHRGRHYARRGPGGMYGGWGHHRGMMYGCGWGGHMMMGGCPYN